MIHITDNLDGTWTVRIGSRKVAKLTCVETPHGDGGSRRALSLDVQPTGRANLEAIAFGADPAFDEDRMTLGPEPNGTIREGAQPFVCVWVKPTD